MADSDGQRVKVYKPDEADGNEKVSAKRSMPMVGTILGLVLLIILVIVLVVNLLR
jgi:hypothetical protein